MVTSKGILAKIDKLSLLGGRPQRKCRSSISMISARTDKTVNCCNINAFSFINEDVFSLLVVSKSGIGELHI